jgi:hypothetical protein
MPSLQRLLYIYFSMKGSKLIEDAEMVITGNGWVQQRNGEMAAKTVRDYMAKLKSYLLTSHGAL